MLQYFYMMTVLEKALEAARKLPENAQAEMALDIMERVAAFGTSLLSPTQDAEIRRRLSKPPEYVSEDEMRAFFGKHHVEL
jgi:hypothetical protein